MDASLFFNSSLDSWGAFDLALSGADLASGNDLQTAVFISLFTDRLCNPDDDIPDGTTHRRGWWGDTYPNIDGDLYGSRLWLLSREKQLPGVLAKAKQYCLEALQWLLDDNIASQVQVFTEFTRPRMLGIQVSICRQDERLDYKFDYAWQELAVSGQNILNSLPVYLPLLPPSGNSGQPFGLLLGLTHS